MTHSASPFNPRRGEAAPSPAALAGLVERARDERFRLLAVMNDARRATQGNLAPSSAPSSTPDADRGDAAEALTRACESSARLLAALTGLNDRLRERHEQLETAEARLAARLDVLEAATARRVEAEVQRRVETVVVDAEKRLALLATGIARRLEATLESAVRPDPRLAQDAA